MSRFQLGRLVATPAAIEAIDPDRVLECLARHAQCDWGDIDEHDRAVNSAALQHGSRLLSVYPIAEGSDERFWIITEADRSVTTVLLPADY